MSSTGTLRRHLTEYLKNYLKALVIRCVCRIMPDTFVTSLSLYTGIYVFILKANMFLVHSGLSLPTIATRVVHTLFFPSGQCNDSQMIRPVHPIKCVINDRRGYQNCPLLSFMKDYTMSPLLSRKEKIFYFVVF